MACSGARMVVWLMRGARRACGAGAPASVRGPFGLPSMLGRCGPARQLGPAGLRHAWLFARIALRVWAPHRRRRTRTAHPALWAHGRSHASVISSGCVLIIPRHARAGTAPGAAFLLRDNYLAQPARFIPDTSARRRGSRGEASTHVTCRPPACAGVGDGLDSRLRGNDGMYVIPAQAHWCPQ